MTEDMASSHILTLYDIKNRPPIEKTCCGPNPWKARYALNFKHAPYSTSWTDLPDVAKVRKGLNMPAGRKFADGEDFYTFPIVQDHETGSLIGDSFDIAVYLQEKYSEAGDGDLFPTVDLDFKYEVEILVPLSKVETKAFPNYLDFNVGVDAAFSQHVGLTTVGYPFDPAVEEQAKAEFIRRAAPYGIKRWEDFTMAPEAREKTLQSFEKVLSGLAVLFSRNGGPFLLGAQACHGDFIVGGWLQMFSKTLPTQEWEQLRIWHGGIFGILHDALQMYAQVL